MQWHSISVAGNAKCVLNWLDITSGVCSGSGKESSPVLCSENGEWAKS